jgi:sortase A
MWWSRPRATSVLLGVVLALAGWEFGSGVFIYAKAHVGQWLIGRAWASSLHTQQPVKPWAWADTVPIGRLVVKELGVDQYVLSGASGRTLAFGPGHYSGTVYPGDQGKAVLAGHRDTHFRFLNDLQVGQVLAFQNRTGAWHHFVVEQMVVMDVHEEQLRLEAETHGLVLITCYPVHAIVPGGPLRYLVYATQRERSAS